MLESFYELLEKYVSEVSWIFDIGYWIFNTHERSLSVMRYGLTNDTVFYVRPIRIFFSPNLSGTITCRPAVGLNSLKPVKFLSPAPHERSLSVMRYGLTNDTVF